MSVHSPTGRTTPYACTHSPNRQVVEKTPEPAWARRRGTKRKAGGKGEEGKGKKGRKGKAAAEAKLPALNPSKILEAHPVSE